MIRSTFAFPVLIAAVTLAGLVIALTGDGWRDAAAWVALCLHLLVVAWAAARISRPKGSS